jgi:hypothetical protein
VYQQATKVLVLVLNHIAHLANLPNLGLADLIIPLTSPWKPPHIPAIIIACTYSQTTCKHLYAILQEWLAEAMQNVLSYLTVPERDALT